MSKILSESLQEYRDLHQEKPVEKLEESLSQGGKLFRELFLPAGHSLIKAGRTEDFQKIVNWAKKLKELGWPKIEQLKQQLGEKRFKSFEALLNFMSKQKPSFAVTPGRGETSGKGGDIGPDNKTRITVISGATGLSSDEVIALIKK